MDERCGPGQPAALSVADFADEVARMLGGRQWSWTTAPKFIRACMCPSGDEQLVFRSIGVCTWSLSSQLIIFACRH
jgi:hypothetical protein